MEAQRHLLKRSDNFLEHLELLGQLHLPNFTTESASPSLQLSKELSNTDKFPRERPAQRALLFRTLSVLLRPFHDGRHSNKRHTKPLTWCSAQKHGVKRHSHGSSAEKLGENVVDATPSDSLDHGTFLHREWTRTAKPEAWFVTRASSIRASLPFRPNWLTPQCWTMRLSSASMSTWYQAVM